ncbi:hypothetical protein [Amycolatopsis japonica]
MSEHPETTNSLNIETFELHPTKMHRVILGRFSMTGPPPRFRMVFHERDLESRNVITYHDSPLKSTRGRYLLVRHFQSFSQQVHTLTVRFASEEDKELDVD